MKFKGKDYSIILSISIISFFFFVHAKGFIILSLLLFLCFWRMPSLRKTLRKKFDPIISFWIKYNKKIGNWEVENLNFKKLNFKKIGYKTILFSVIAILIIAIGIIKFYPKDYQTICRTGMENRSGSFESNAKKYRKKLGLPFLINETTYETMDRIYAFCENWK